jgi:hypothetical protein
VAGYPCMPQWRAQYIPSGKDAQLGTGQQAKVRVGTLNRTSRPDNCKISVTLTDYTHRPRPGILSALALITTVNFQIAVNRQVPVTAMSSAFPFRIL